MSGTPPALDRQLAAGCVLGSYVGTDVPSWLIERVRGGLGGVLLFAQNIVDDAQVAAACGTIRAARTDVVIAIDEEGGDVTRLDASSGSPTPSPAAFGVVDDPGLTFSAAADLGARVRAIGIDLTLAPCADINSNPLNPIIGLRSFGVSADRVARHVVAAVEGFRSAGLGACVKHYPGHGDTSADTHRGAAEVTATMDVLEARELVPFSAAVAGGVDAVLTAHIVVGAVDELPASLSVRWSEHLRRAGFDGAIITDALDMDAVACGRGIDGVAEAAVSALRAGADLLCVGSNFDATMTDGVVDAVATAIADGVLDRSALARSRDRNRHLARKDHALSARTQTQPGAAAIVAARAISVEGQVPRGPFAVIECRPPASIVCGNVQWGVAEHLAARGWATAAITADGSLDACARFVATVTGHPLLVVVRDAWLHPWQTRVVEHCLSLVADGAVVVAELGWNDCRTTRSWPSGLAPAATIVTHGAARSSVQALIELLVKES